MKQRHDAHLAQEDRLEQTWRDTILAARSLHVFQQATFSPLAIESPFGVIMVLSLLMENPKSKGITTSCGCTNHICNTQHKNS